MRRRRRLMLFGCAVVVGGFGGACLYLNRQSQIEARPAAEPGVSVVVLLHGLGRTSVSMAPLGTRLESAGYDVRNWDYPSTQETIEETSKHLRAFLSSIDADPKVDRIHIVTHSLGGIVARHALTIEKPSKMGRVVMLAPPNKGSASADFWTPIVGGVIKPLGELKDDSDSVVNQMGVPEDVEIGVIAAADDGKVKVADTHIEGETDHIVVPGYHTFIMNRGDVAQQVIHFLEKGLFEHDAGGGASG